MAFMNGWNFLFLQKNEDNELFLTSDIHIQVPLASVDDLFKSKQFQDLKKTYIIAKEGVYSYSSMNNTWYKSK